MDEVALVRPAASAARVVLLVEDEPLLRLVVGQSLRESGFQVIEAVSGDEALTVLAAGAAFDAVVTDFKMPGKTDGLELASFIRRHRAGTPVVLVSGALTNPPKGCEVDGFLAKPHYPAEVVTLVRSLLLERE